MKTNDMNSIFKPSENIVARELEGEIIIVPLRAGIGDGDDELFTLNETGRQIWRLLDGQRTVKDIVNALSARFSGSAAEIEKDVLGLLAEFKRRRFISRKMGS